MTRYPLDSSGALGGVVGAECLLCWRLGDLETGGDHGGMTIRRRSGAVSTWLSAMDQAIAEENRATKGE
jgi:hypothetical protein